VYRLRGGLIGSDQKNQDLRVRIDEIFVRQTHMGLFGSIGCIETQRRERVEPFANDIEAPIAIEQPLTCASGNLGAETEVFELFLISWWNRHWLFCRSRRRHARWAVRNAGCARLPHAQCRSLIAFT